MELDKAIYERRSIRAFTGQPVDADVVLKLIDAANQAPSALNLQPWAFGVYIGRERLRRFSDEAKAHLLATTDPLVELHTRSEQYAKPEYDVFYGAETLIVIFATQTRFNPAEDCCLAAQNLMLAAHGLGLGSCPLGFLRPWLNLPDTKRELEVPDTYTAVFPVVIGHPAITPEPVHKREPTIVCWKKST